MVSTPPLSAAKGRARIPLPMHNFDRLIAASNALLPTLSSRRLRGELFVEPYPSL
jgi:hypothetical protein